MLIPVGIQVSVGKKSDNSFTTDPTQMVWYKLTDHNRNPIAINYELIENTQRMADGTLRKYVVARKFKITSDWTNLPTRTLETVDGGYGAAWIKAFYEGNAFAPVWIKMTFAQDDTPGIFQVPSDSTYQDSFGTDAANSVYNAYMSSFSYDVLKRNAKAGNKGFDLVNLKIEFTEI